MKLALLLLAASLLGASVGVTSALVSHSQRIAQGGAR